MSISDVSDVTPTDQQPTSILGATAGAPSQAAPNYPASPDQGGPVPAPSSAAPAQPTSRLAAILSAVAKVASTGLQGVPDRGRPSFTTGLGEGARSEQANINNQQAIKFKTFDDQVRLAQLHNQDLKMQQDTQAQQDAHIKAELDNRNLASQYGIDYDTLPSHGPTVMDHLTGQTAASGAASVPPGTHLSGDGETINIPKDTQATRDGQKQMYSNLAPALGLPSLPDNVDFVPAPLMNMLTNKIHGFGVDGKPINHTDLPGMIASTQAQRDQLAKSGGTPQQLQTLDNVLGIYQANLDALDKHATTVKQQSEQAKIDADTSDQSIAGKTKLAKSLSDVSTQAAIAKQNNAAGNKAASDAAKASAKAATAASDPNNVIGGYDALQSRVNDIAEFVNSPAMARVDPKAAGRIMEAAGVTLGAHAGGMGVPLPMGGANASNLANFQAVTNPETLEYTNRLRAGYEAISQLPRLQTYGKSSRMSPVQMEAAKQLMPAVYDNQTNAQNKLKILQDTLDSYVSHIPNGGASGVRKSWRNQQQPAQ